MGIIAAFIDIVSQWLGTLRTGVCSKWYLNSVFCCWKELEGTCDSWSTWTPYAILNFVVFTVLSLILALGACVLVCTFAPEAKLSGIPEIRAMIFGSEVSSSFLTGKTLVIKAVGLCLSVGSGLWVGNEAPLVHVAGCCTSLCIKALYFAQGKLRHWTTEQQSKADKQASRLLHDLLPACAAAGISVAFGTPIGGVVYALECVSSSYTNNARSMWNSFVTAMAAAVALQTVNPFHSGQLVLFQVSYDRPWHIFEVFCFAAIGVFGGLFGTALISLNSKVCSFLKSEACPVLLRNDMSLIAIVSLCSSILAYPFTYLRVPSSMLIAHLFRECSPDYDLPAGLCDGTNKGLVVTVLLLCCIIGFFLTCISYGLSVPAGVLMPTMVCGALFGRAVGLTVQSIQLHNPNSSFFLRVCPPSDGSAGQCVTPGVYALVGAAATLTGVTRMTVSCVVIVCEFTGALTYVIPIMAGVMISKWVADAFSRSGIDEHWIRSQLQIPLIDNVAHFAAPVPDTAVGDIATMASQCFILYRETDIDTIRQALDSTFKGFPVVQSLSEPVVLGHVSRQDLLEGFASIDPSQITTVIFDAATAHDRNSTTVSFLHIVDRNPICIPLNAKIITAVHLFQTLGVSYLLLEDRGKFGGMVTTKDIWTLLARRQASSVCNVKTPNGTVGSDNEADSLLQELE